MPQIVCACRECGREFRRWPSQAVAPRGCYCSRHCRAVAVGRSQPRGPDSPFWITGVHAYRELAKRPGANCARCGSTRRLQVHHRDENRLNNAPDNHEVLCVSCHRVHHATTKFSQTVGRCATCGVGFLTWPHEGGRKYCSRACCGKDPARRVAISEQLKARHRARGATAEGRATQAIHLAKMVQASREHFATSRQGSR